MYEYTYWISLSVWLSAVSFVFKWKETILQPLGRPWETVKFKTCHTFINLQQPRWVHVVKTSSRHQVTYLFFISGCLSPCFCSVFLPVSLLNDDHRPPLPGGMESNFLSGRRGKQTRKFICRLKTLRCVRVQLLGRETGDTSLSPLQHQVLDVSWRLLASTHTKSWMSLSL